jgi:hypothetical protein
VPSPESRHKGLWSRAFLRFGFGTIIAGAGMIAGSGTLVYSRATSSSPANILLSRGRTEPTIAVNPLRPNTIVASANTNYSEPVAGSYPTAFYDSQDGGNTFSAGLAPMHAPYTTGADTTVSIALDGTVFYSYLGETPAYCSGGRSAVLLTHSIDGGRSFKAPTVVDADPSDDKPNLAVESVAGRPSHIFITWTRWHDKSSELWFSRSVDGGVTFSKPALLWSSSLDNFGSVPAIGPRGRIYVFWSVFPEGSLTAPEPTGIFVRVSADDGAHFGSRRAVSPTFQAVPRMVAPGLLRNLPMAAVAVDSDGAVYAAWSAVTRNYRDQHVDADVRLSRSVDGGTIWSRPRRVNDVRHGDRFMPAMAVMSRGVVGLAYYDRRSGLQELDVYAVKGSFVHGFHASANVRVSAGSSPISDITYIAPGSTCFSPGRFFGDYIGVAPQRSRLCVVWADTQLHVPGETDIWFARVDLNR